MFYQHPFCKIKLSKISLSTNITMCIKLEYKIDEKLNRKSLCCQSVLLLAKYNYYLLAYDGVDKDKHISNDHKGWLTVKKSTIAVG